MNDGLVNAGEIKNNTKLFRYINLSQFVFWVETQSTYLTKVMHWTDLWEIPVSKVTLSHLNSNKIYGQSWSLNGESDALWRIYSSNKEGLLIQTSVSKFKLLKDIKSGMLAPVIYYKNLEDGLEELKNRKQYSHKFGQAFLKRAAFNHEQEVRLVTVNDEDGLFIPRTDEEHIYIELDPVKFIENIIIDPRSSSWYVETVQKYCYKNRFGFTPSKSDIYSTNIYEAAHLAKDLSRTIQELTELH